MTASLIAMVTFIAGETWDFFKQFSKNTLTHYAGMAVVHVLTTRGEYKTTSQAGLVKTIRQTRHAF